MPPLLGAPFAPQVASLMLRAMEADYRACIESEVRKGYDGVASFRIAILIFRGQSWNEPGRFGFGT